MTGSNNRNWGLDHESHHLLSLKVIPRSLLSLRRELAKNENRDIYESSYKGETFEECLGIIGAELGVALNGYYDVEKLCGVLLAALKKRHIRTPTIYSC